MNHRTLLGLYRKFIYKICNRSTIGTLPSGRMCDLNQQILQIHNGDIVHPCVRYCPEGCLGHKWWMVYTPYYRANPSTENPILCYGDSESSDSPKKWIFHSEIKPRPKKGYNSDPNLFIEDGSLVIFWRENQTERCTVDNCSRATYALRISSNEIIEYPQPLLTAQKEFCDSEVSPAFVKYGNEYYAYATKVRFFYKTIKNLPNPIKSIVNKFLLGIDLLGIYPLHKSYGIAVWKGNNLNEPFVLQQVSAIKRHNHLYQPWHLDVFEYLDNVYAVVQTNQCNADICLAKSTDRYTFEFFKKPLITNNSIGKVGIYKPCGIVVNGIFHLFYTAQDIEDRRLNKLYHTSMPFEQLLAKIQ